MVTKKILIILLISMSATLCFGQDKKNTSVTVNLNGFDTGYMVCGIVQIDERTKEVKKTEYDTIAVKGGRAILYFQIENFAIITIDFWKEFNKYGPIVTHDSYQVNLFAYPNDKINVRAQVFDDRTIDYSLTGNKLNEEYSEFRSSLTSSYRIFNSTMAESPDPVKRPKELQDKINKSLGDKEKICLAYYNGHLDSPLCAFINISNYYYAFPDKEREIKELSPKALDSPLGIYYNAVVEQYKQELILRKENRIKDSLNHIERMKMEGKLAPDFTVKDVSGKEITLSSFRGKYVVLDFWFLGCAFCPRSIEELRIYSKKYPGKFEVITINIDDSPDTIKTVIKDLGMEDFMNTLDHEKAVFNMYKLMGVPSVILIYPDGKLEYIRDINKFDQIFGNV